MCAAQALGCLARAMGPVLPGVSSARAALLRAPRPLHSGVFAKAGGAAAPAAAAAGKKGGKKGGAKDEGAEGREWQRGWRDTGWGFEGGLKLGAVLAGVCLCVAPRCSRR